MSNENLKSQLEDLQYELSITLEAMLLFAGVKREKLEISVQTYIECIDEVLQNSQNEGVDEILEVIAHLKRVRKDLFK